MSPRKKTFISVKASGEKELKEAGKIFFFAILKTTVMF